MLGTCGEDDVIVTFFVIRKGFYFLFIFCYFCKNSYRRLLRLILWASVTLHMQTTCLLIAAQSHTHRKNSPGFYGLDWHFLLPKLNDLLHNNCGMLDNISVFCQETNSWNSHFLFSVKWPNDLIYLAVSGRCRLSTIFVRLLNHLLKFPKSRSSSY